MWSFPLHTWDEVLFVWRDICTLSGTHKHNTRIIVGLLASPILVWDWNTWFVSVSPVPYHVNLASNRINATVDTVGYLSIIDINVAKSIVTWMCVTWIITLTIILRSITILQEMDLNLLSGVHHSSRADSGIIHEQIGIIYGRYTYEKVGRNCVRDCIEHPHRSYIIGISYWHIGMSHLPIISPLPLYSDIYASDTRCEQVDTKNADQRDVCLTSTSTWRCWVNSVRHSEIRQMIIPGLVAPPIPSVAPDVDLKK